MTRDQPLATQAGLIIGTPGYMAPEMAISDAVDGRADLYALGCVAYYLLTGHQVFEGGSPMQVISKHLQAAPPPPSARALQPMPAGLDQVILACLAKQPDERPRTAAILAERLSAIERRTMDRCAGRSLVADRTAVHDRDDSRGTGRGSDAAPAGRSGQRRHPAAVAGIGRIATRAQPTYTTHTV